MTAGSDEKIEYLKRNFGLNENYLINYKNSSFRERIMSVTENRGVDYIFDCVGGSYWQMNAECLSTGKLSGMLCQARSS